MKLYRKKRILYVTSNTAVAFQIINSGIVDNLRRFVREVRVVNARNDNPLEAAAGMKPDLMLFISGNVIRPEGLTTLRRLRIPTAVWYTDNPYNTDFIAATAPYYDFVFTQEIACLSFFHLLGCRSVHLLPLAANTKIFYPPAAHAPKPLDVCFIGTAWSNRLELIDAVSPYLAERRVYLAGPGWDALPHYHLLASKIRHEALTMEETRRRIAQAKIVLNLHRAYNETTGTMNRRRIYAHSVNPRVFEIGAAGAFQLSDERMDLGRLYAVGKEVATFSGPEDLIRKIGYYLGHEQEREAIAQAGWQRTMREHTYEHRVRQLLRIVFG